MSNYSHTHDDHLARWASDARKFPLVTAEQEREFTRRWREAGDADALTLLLGSHLRLVIKIAYKNRGYGLPVADLIAEGNVGLMQAAERFDPDRGFRFSTYAQWWIRAAIQEYVLRNRSLVRMGTTAAQKKLFFNLRRLKSSLDAYEDSELSPEAAATIAAELDVSKDEVIAMNRRLSGDSSLNVPIGGDGAASPLDMLEDETPDQEMAFGEAEVFRKRRDLVAAAIDELTPRERHILTERKLREEPRTLQDLSHVHGVSRERIRQIEVRALEKLRRSVRADAAAQGLLGASQATTAALKAAA